MRTALRSATVIVVVVGALAASGCSPEPPTPPTAAPTSTPLFASDEEALAAAEEAYAAYVAVTDAIFQGGGVDLSQLASVAAGKQLSNDTVGFEEIAANGYRSIGTTTFGAIELQQYSRDSKRGVVIVYLCEDVSGVDVLDQSGTSVVQPDRPNQVKYEVTFDRNPEPQSPILVANRVPWGDGHC